MPSLLNDIPFENSVQQDDAAVKRKLRFIIGGTFNNPVIYYVMVINADNAAFAQEIKEMVFNDKRLGNASRTEASNYLEFYEIGLGERVVRGYNREAFGYSSKAGFPYASLPSYFKSYGYTQQQQDGSGVFAEAEETGTAKRLRFSKGTATVEAEEAEQRTPPSAGARLMGGSYLLDVNNKIVIIGGSFKNPVIHYVMVINADNATDAQESKEVVFKHEHLKSLTAREASSGIGIYETYFGQKIVRGYDSKDFGYNAQAANLYARLPDGFRSYGYTQQQQDGSGVSAEDEEARTAKGLRYSKGTATVETEEAEGSWLYRALFAPRFGFFEQASKAVATKRKIA